VESEDVLRFILHREMQYLVGSRRLFLDVVLRLAMTQTRDVVMRLQAIVDSANG
jgi:hypothetical protein